MAIKNTLLGGTDLTAEVGKSVDMNDTFDAVVTHLVTVADSTEYTDATGSYVDAGSSFTVGSTDDLLESIFFEVSMKNQDANFECNVRLSINDGTQYYMETKVIDQATSYAAPSLAIAGNALFTSRVNTYNVFSATISPNLKLAAAATVKVQFKTNDSGEGHNALIDESTIRIRYITGYSDE